MKILFITGLHPLASNPMSGIFITRRLKKLKEYGVNYDLYFFSERISPLARLLKGTLKRPSFKEKKAIRVHGVQYSPLPVAMSAADMVFYHKSIGPILANAVKTSVNLKEYDLVHAIWVYPHGYAAALLKQETGLPCVVSAHGSDIHTNPEKFPRSLPAVLFALEICDRALFNNHKLLEKARELGYKGANATVIPNGVDTSVFFPLDKESARGELGLAPPPVKYVGFVGNLKPVKGADRLPEIFREIARQYEPVRFVVIGGGSLRRMIEQKCRSYNLAVQFTGTIATEAMPAWMSALDVLILPSRKEGFPNVCLEAQACGCPVVGSSAGGIPEAVGDGGDIVAGAESNFAQEMSNKVIRLLEKPLPRERLRERALQFDWDRIILKQIKMYEELLKEG